MNGLLFGLKIGLVLSTFIVFGGFLYLLLIILAKNNLFFTYIKEGSVKAVMKFGEFHKMVMVYKDHRLDVKGYIRHIDDKGKIAKISNGEIDPTLTQPNADYYKIEFESDALAIFPGGIRWIGNPFKYTIHSYKFRWMSLRQKSNEDGNIRKELVQHDEEIDYILAQDDVYATVVKGAETKEMVPLEALMLLTIRILNPYKALFRVQDWLEQSLNITNPSARSWIGTKTYHELTNEGGTEQKESPILTESSLDEEILEDYGVKIKKIGFEDFTPDGARAISYIEAASKAYEAEQSSKAVHILADAEAYRIQKTYETVQSFGETGALVRTAEAIEKAAEKGGSTIIPLGSLQSIFGNIFGGQQPRSKKTPPVQSS